MSKIKIRQRHRTGYSKEFGGYTGWHEWQVVDGRKVIGRFDMKSQAERYVAEVARRAEALSDLARLDADLI